MPSITKTRKKTRRYKRDIDQIHADLRDPRHLERYKETKAVEDLPDLGQWYCMECAKWFTDEANFTSHVKGKSHKRRLKQLKEEPHTQKEADAAIGLRTDNGPYGKRVEDENMAVESS